ncbi:MAG: hypothetical protein HY074_00200 [Deltaproteobacteria bacterium]|nr:hypothetical protein [Deltaproteobacteria bacterium]
MSATILEEGPALLTVHEFESAIDHIIVGCEFVLADILGGPAKTPTIQLVLYQPRLSNLVLSELVNSRTLRNAVRYKLKRELKRQLPEAVIANMEGQALYLGPCPEMTVLGMRRVVENPIVKFTSDDWHESTGGIISQGSFLGIIDHLRKGHRIVELSASGSGGQECPWITCELSQKTFRVYSHRDEVWRGAFFRVLDELFPKARVLIFDDFKFEGRVSASGNAAG